MSRRTLSLILLLAAARAGAQEFGRDWRSQLPPADGVPGIRATVVRGPAGPGGPQAGQFDAYVLALSWFPQFCRTKDAPECGTLSPERWEGRNLALHGLWPNKENDPSHSYGYCGVSPETRALDKRDTWCRLPPFGLSGSELAALSTYMPGTQSCLQNHEWYKHGSCSGLDAGDYFALAAGITAKFASTAPGRFITENVGRTVTLRDFLAAFEAEFGRGSGRSAGLRCANADGRPMLAELRLELSATLRRPEELDRSLLPSDGNCPESFLILAPR